MARIFGATYQPYTYEELAAPLREATVAHQKVEEDYNNNMLVVDSLRQRAQSELETNPKSKWANSILNYANQLEGYAMDLARNGLTRETSRNLLNMKRGFGNTVSPVITAMARESALLKIRDSQIGNGVIFGRMPTIDEIIANPNIGLSSYDKNDLYKLAHDTAKAMSERNIKTIMPYNYNALLYAYGVEKGFSNADIQNILNNDPGFKQTFGEVMRQSGYLNDDNLTPEQKTELSNMVVLGALNGFEYDKEINYKNRGDYLNPLQKLLYKKLLDEDNGSGLGGYTGPVERKKYIFRTAQEVPDPLKQNKKGDPDAITGRNVVVDIDSENREDIRQKFFSDKSNTYILKKYNGAYVLDEKDRVDTQTFDPVALEIDEDRGIGTRIVWRSKDGKQVKTAYFDEGKGKDLQYAFLKNSYKRNSEYEHKINQDGAFKKRNIDNIISNFDDEKLKLIDYSKNEILKNSKTMDNDDFVFYFDNMASKYYYTEYANALINGEDLQVLNTLQNQWMEYYTDMIGYNRAIEDTNTSIEDVLSNALLGAGTTIKVEPIKIKQE